MKSFLLVLLLCIIASLVSGCAAGTMLEDELFRLSTEAGETGDWTKVNEHFDRKSRIEERRERRKREKLGMANARRYCDGRGMKLWCKLYLGEEKKCGCHPLWY